MKTRIHLSQVVLLLGVWNILYVFGNSHEICGVIKADPRDIPGAMNGIVGNKVNIFINLTVPMSGMIKSISFYAVRSGNAYVSFWKDLGNQTFQLANKVEVTSTERSAMQIFLINENVYVEQGHVLALHYKSSNNNNGVIGYEDSETTRTPNVTVYSFFNVNTQDDGWEIGKTLTFSSMASGQKGVALHVRICTCVNGRFGGNCSEACSGNCRNDETCNFINGTCDRGCKDGFYETDMCNLPCNDTTYGHNCSETCHNCIDQVCNPGNGHCEQGCIDGFDQNASPKCDTGCRFQRFGPGCAMTCHCANGDTCNRVTGVCPGGCESGWTSPQCASRQQSPPQSDENDTDQEESNGGLLAGAIIMFLIAVLAIIFIIFFIWRRLRERKSEKYVAEANVKDDEDPENITTESEDQSLYVNAQVPPPPGQSRAIPVENFHEVLTKLSPVKMKEEYNNIPKISPQKKCTFAAHEALIPKNKFKNIHPYDENRIILEKISDDPWSDYINASPIKGYDRDRKDVYIACQGPQKTTMNDFWRMVWQYKVYAIVMLTNLIENMRIKCEQYWPSEGYLTLGGVRISLEKEETFGDIVIRHLKATKNSETRWLKQFQYVDWPDHDAPKTTNTIITLRKEVRKFQTKYVDSPVAVHCSAGVGRTGTFISIDYLLDLAKKTNYVDVLKCVNHLRKARANMVQTYPQYQFIYNVLDEYLTLGGTEMKTAEIPDRVKTLLNTAEGDARMKQEYQFLEDAKPKFGNGEMQIALKPENKAKNQDLNVLPADQHLLQLESEDGRGGEYINALEIEGFKAKAGYVVTQVPLNSTGNEFWRLLMENNLQNVVYIRQEGSQDDAWFPKASSALDFWTMSAIHKQSERVGDTEIVHVEVVRLDAPEEGDIYTNVPEQQAVYANTDQLRTEAEKVSVTFFIHPSIQVGDDSGHVIGSLSTLLAAVERSAISGQPLAIMCLNGAKDSGLYMACHMLTKMFEKAPAADVFNAVQRIRSKRPQFIGSIGEYTFLYKFALAWASREETQEVDEEDVAN